MSEADKNKIRELEREIDSLKNPPKKDAKVEPIKMVKKKTKKK